MRFEDGAHLHELLEVLEAGILSLERDQGTDPAVAIHRLFQSAHNLKSGLAMAGLERASKRFHGLEDGLDDIRRGRTPWTAAWADAVLDTVDAIRVCLDGGDDTELSPEFQPPEGPSGALPAARPWLPDVGEVAARTAALGLRLFRIEKLFLPGLTQEEFEGHLIYEDIHESGTLLSVQPDWATYSKSTGETVVRFLFSTAKTADELAELFFDPLIPVDLPAPASGPGPQFSILVVDDDVTLALVVRKSVEPFGPVVVAHDGQSGVEEFRKAFGTDERFDVVILDLEMPGMNGHEVLRAIREGEEAQGVLGLDRCLVFMNTSNDELSKVKASFRLQADRYFIKPLSVDQIKKRLEESLPWLETRRRSVR